MRSAISLPILVLLLLAGCRSSAGDAAELLAADRAFCAATQERGLEAWVETFDANGSQFDERFAPVTGHDRIRAWMKPLFDEPGNQLVWEPDTATISEAGNLGSTSGRFTMSVLRADGTREVVTTGRYFDVWRRMPDGRWKLVVDIGEPDPRPYGVR